MKIVAPLNRYNEINALIDAGADELYCGLLDKKQWQRYASIGCLNRRGEIFSNLNSLKELESAVKISHNRNVPLTLALNEYYNEDQAVVALKQAREAVDCGVDGLLVADLGLILKLKGKLKDTELYLSSCATVFNSEAVKFYTDLGVSRIVLPRHLNIGELKRLKDLLPERLGIEVFVLNERCFNLDGFCSFQHGKLTAVFKYGFQSYLNRLMKRYIRLLPGSILKNFNRDIVKNDHVCCFPFQGGPSCAKGEMFIFNTPESFLYACGICALYDFCKIGLSHVKIAGRSILTDQIRNVSLIKQVLGLLNNKITKKEFIARAKDMAIAKGRACRPDLCYYP